MTREAQRYISSLSYREILIDEIIQGLGELRRSALGLTVSGLSAGLDLGFSMLLMATALTFTEGYFNEATQHIIVANLYSVGFILVVMGRSELFTEHTSLAVFPVLARRAMVASLLRLWGIVYVANIVGALGSAILIATVGPGLDAIEDHAFATISGNLLDHPWWLMTLSAVVAGWLMGLLAWLISAATDTVGRIFFIWLITTSIGLVPLHHCVLGAVEVGSAMIALDGVALGDFLRFLSASTLGNLVGGVVFVALIKYGHAVRSEQLPAAAEEVLADVGDGVISGEERRTREQDDAGEP